jgi:hypothetical protein
MSKSYTHGVSTDHWSSQHEVKVRVWLAENFGVNGDRWKHEFDFGLESLGMDEDVYMAYLLRWE